MNVGIVLSGTSEPTDPTCRRFLDGLVPALAKNGVRTHVFAKHPRQKRRPAFRGSIPLGDAGGKMPPGAYARKAAAQLTAHVRRLRIDVLHMHGVKTEADAAALRGVLARTGVRGVLTVQSPPARGPRMRAFLSHLDALTAVSAPLLRDFCRFYPFLRAKGRVIPNGIDGRLFRPGKTAGRGTLVFTAGRNLPYKGMDIVFLAFHDVLRRGVKARLALCGDGYGDGRMQAWARLLGIERSVKFLGLLEAPALAKWLRRSAVFCLASRFEGHSLAALEAMACGLPAVLTRVGHVDAGLRRAARLVSAQDPHALAGALARLLKNPRERIRLGARARAYVGKYSWEKIAEQYRKVYEAAN